MFKKLFGRTEAQATIAKSMEELRLKQATNSSVWGLGSTERWDADLEQGIIHFSGNDGTIVSAPVQVIGTLNSADGTWLWGWDHPSVKEPLAHAAMLCRSFGERHGLRRFTERKIACSEDEAWEQTAVALHLSEGQGPYRGPAGSTLVFMTFGEITIQKPN